MPFHLWPAQVGLLWALLTNRLVLILKARQLGISWICCWYALWLCFWQPGKFVLLLSRGQDEANEMLRRVKVLYLRLPDWMKAAGPQVIKLNTEEIAWENESRIQSLPASPGSGRSFTASLAIMDEAAFMQYATEVYTALKPTVDGGGSLIVLSTANGKANLFFDMCARAMEGAGRFVFRFLPWYVRPGRDQAWYTSVAADAVDEGHMKQEYPATADEAFEATEVDRFIDIHLWDACEDTSLPPLDAHTPCVLALDGSESDDTFPLVIVSRHPADPTRFAVRKCHIWTPIPGVVLDDTLIEAEIRDWCERYAIQEIAYDRALIGQLMRRLTTQTQGGPKPIAVPAEKFNQGKDRLEADKAFYDLITQRRIAHDGNVELRAHIANANKKKDSAGHMRIIKRTHVLKIDAAVACAMAAMRAADVLEMPAEGFALSYDTRRTR